MNEVIKGHLILIWCASCWAAKCVQGSSVTTLCKGLNIKIVARLLPSVDTYKIDDPGQLEGRLRCTESMRILKYDHTQSGPPALKDKGIVFPAHDCHNLDLSNEVYTAALAGG